MKKKTLFEVFIGLLILSLSVFAAAPTVDFNWTPYPEPLTYQTVVFDPTITGSPLIDLNWQFNSDGNVNYSIGGTTSILYDNFSNGDVNTPTNWITQNYSETDGLLTSPTGIDSSAWTSKNIAFDQNIEWDFNLNVIGAELAAGYSCFASSSNMLSGSLGYSIWSRVGETIKLGYGCSGQSVIVDSGVGVSSGSTYKIKIKRSTDANWVLYVNDSYTGNGIENSRQDANYILFTTGGITSTFKIGDLNIQKKNSDSIDSDKNESKVFLTSGKKAVCLTAKNSDGSTTTCHDVNVAGNAVIQVWDENTNLVISNASMSFNGETYSTTNGVFSIETPATNGEYAFVISASNYPARTFYFYVDANSSFSKQVYLLDSNKINTYDFVLRDSTGSKYNEFGVSYANKLFRIEKNGKLVWQSYSNSTNVVYGVPLANLTTDYNFFVDYNTDNVNIFDYNDAILTIRVPKNEKTLEAITPFGVHVKNLTAIDINNLTTVKSFKIYPNTKQPYIVTIDANESNYFFRNYSIRAWGGQSQMLDSSTDIILQPYLLRQVDGAAQATFTVSDSLTGNKIPFYTIEFRTGVGNMSNVLVESPMTDSAGQLIFTSVTNQQYNVVVINDFGDVVKQGLVISTTSSTYFLDIFSGVISISVPSTGSVDLNVIVPQSNIFYMDDSNEYNFQFKLISNNMPVSSIRTTITQNGVTLRDINFVPSGFSTSLTNGTIFDVNFAGGSPLYVVNVVVQINTPYGPILKSFKYPLKQTHNPMYSLPNFQPLLNDIGVLGGILLWFFGAIVITSVMRFIPTYGVDNNAMVWLLAIYTGVVAYAGIIPMTIALIAIIGGIALWLFQRRPIG